jgi:3D (Asp-Asp-Asp) domain-containing protein
MKKILLTLTLTIALLVSGVNEGSASSPIYTVIKMNLNRDYPNQDLATLPTYTVKKGDTLYRISRMHDTTVESLKSLNNLKSDIIFPNQKLNVLSNANNNKILTASIKTPALKKIASNTIASKTPSRSTTDNVVKEFSVEATAYTAYCEGCSGITKTGINLRQNSDLKVIAVDPNVIKLGTKVYVEGYGYAIAGDIGGAIKGNKIDVFIPTLNEALQWGRKNVKISILE